MDDKRIIELLFDRNEQALQFIEERYGNLIIHITESVLNNLDDSIECKNDTLLAVWNSIPPKNPEFFKAYICKIARNTALNKFRYDAAKKRGSFAEVALDELGDAISVAYNPGELLESKELVRYLNEFLADLSEVNRMLFIRRYFFGDSVEALSGIFDMKSNTISVKLARMRKSLRTYLEEQEVVM